MLKKTAIATALALFATAQIAQAESTSSQVSSAQQAQAVSRTTESGFNELQRAAQRLRESIQAMAQVSPGPQRDAAVRSAHEALFDANQAMLRLPVEYRGRAFTWSASQSAQTRAPAGQTPEQALAQLRMASERLYSAVHAMARAPAGSKRAAAIEDANEALIETHAAMAWVYDRQLVENTGHAGKEATRSRGATASDAQGAAASTAGGTVAGGARAASTGRDTSAVAGGVGINARVKLSEQALPEHNVKMVFALTSGNYVADVGVSVKDRSDHTVIDGTAKGPWLYAKLPPGDYTASATYNGETVTERFKVGSSGQRTAIFRWPASIAQAASGVSPILGTGPQNQPSAAGR